MVPDLELMVWEQPKDQGPTSPCLILTMVFQRVIFIPISFQEPMEVQKGEEKGSGFAKP